MPRPAHLVDFIPLVEPEALDAAIGTDAFAKVTNVFVAGKSVPRSFLLDMRRKIQLKVRSRNIRTKTELVSTYISYIDPDSCEEFLRTYSLKW